MKDIFEGAVNVMLSPIMQMLDPLDGADDDKFLGMDCNNPLNFNM